MAMRQLAVVLAALTLVGCSAQTDPDSRPASAEPVDSMSRAGIEPVELTVRHCWVNPVSFHGEAWAVPLRLNYGGSGGAFYRHYEDWQGQGEMSLVASNRAEYRDDGGSVVTFRPSAFLERVEEYPRLCN